MEVVTRSAATPKKVFGGVARPGIVPRDPETTVEIREHDVQELSDRFLSWRRRAGMNGVEKSAQQKPAQRPAPTFEKPSHSELSPRLFFSELRPLPAPVRPATPEPLPVNTIQPEPWRKRKIMPSDRQYIKAHKNPVRLSLTQAGRLLNVSETTVFLNWKRLGLAPHGLLHRKDGKSWPSEQEFRQAKEDGLTQKEAAIRLGVSAAKVGVVWRGPRLSPNSRKIMAEENRWLAQKSLEGESYRAHG